EKRRWGNVECAGDIRDAVVGIGRATRRNRTWAGGDVTRSRGGGGEGGLGGEAGPRVAGDRTRGAGGRGPARRARELRLALGSEAKRRLGNVEGAGDIRDAVVGIGRATGRDGVRVGGDVARGCRGGGERGLCGEAGARVAVDQSRVAGGQGR